VRWVGEKNAANLGRAFIFEHRVAGRGETKEASNEIRKGGGVNNDVVEDAGGVRMDRWNWLLSARRAWKRTTLCCQAVRIIETQ